VSQQRPRTGQRRQGQAPRPCKPSIDPLNLTIAKV
jgi:hypothetical protein